MQTVVILCVLWQGGLSCLPTATAADCERAKALIILADTVQCEEIEMLLGTIYAPSSSPIPTPKGARP